MAHTFRGSFRRGASAGLRRKSSWQVGPGGAGAQSLNTSSSVIVGAGAQVNEDGLTMVRFRGEFLFLLDSAAGSGSGFRGALGVGITDVTAFGIGVTAMQLPLDDEEWDGWLYHKYFHVLAGDAMLATTAASEGLQGGLSLSSRIEMDSKAMRKLNAEDVIFMIIQVVEEGTASARFNGRARILVKLP